MTPSQKITWIVFYTLTVSAVAACIPGCMGQENIPAPSELSGASSDVSESLIELTESSTELTQELTKIPERLTFELHFVRKDDPDTQLLSRLRITTGSEGKPSDLPDKNFGTESFSVENKTVHDDPVILHQAVHLEDNSTAPQDRFQTKPFAVVAISQTEAGNGYIHIENSIPFPLTWEQGVTIKLVNHSQTN